MNENFKIPNDLFSVIAGYEDVKELFKRSLKSNEPIHILMWGPPSSAKTLFLMELSRISSAVYTLGSSSTKAGLADLLLKHNPKLLLIDEIEKMVKMSDYAILLSVTETGVISETKYRKRRAGRLKLWVVAAANHLHLLPLELKSRFLTLYFPEYDDDTFRQVAMAILTRREGCDRDLARHITDATMGKLSSRDVRDAVRLARVCTSEADVNWMIGTILHHQPTEEILEPIPFGYKPPAPLNLKRPKWTPERQILLKKLFAEGLSDYQIAMELRVGPQSVRKQRWVLGLRKSVSVEISKERIHELLDKGMSFTQIASELGIHPKTLTDKCRKAGIRVPPPGARPKVPTERIIELRKKGLTYKKIGEKVGLHSSTVQSRLENLHIKKEIGGKNP